MTFSVFYGRLLNSKRSSIKYFSWPVLLLDWLPLISGMHLYGINLLVVVGIFGHLIRIDLCPVKTVPIINVNREQF